MHPDLERLAIRLKEWPDGAKYVVLDQETDQIYLNCGTQYGTSWDRAQWLQARQDLGLGNTETPEEKEELDRIEARQAPDMVNAPPHYNQGDIECIDAIRAALTPEEFRGYCKGNALKYVWRELHKGGDESMKKATWYINKATEASARRAGELEG